MVGVTVLYLSWQESMITETFVSGPDGRVRIAYSFEHCVYPKLRSRCGRQPLFNSVILPYTMSIVFMRHH